MLIPQFSQQELGYTAYISGLILSPGGIVVICLIPIVGRIMKYVQTRYVVMFGFAMMGCACVYSSGLAPDIDYGTLVFMRSSQSAALAFLFVPISQITYLTLPQRFRSDGAALYSMFRNVFGSVGISLSTALVTERTQANQAHLSTWATPLHDGYNLYNQASEAALLSLGRAQNMLHDQAVSHTYRTYLRQAAVLAYSNVFLYASVIAFLVVPFCLLISKKTAQGGCAGH